MKKVFTIKITRAYNPNIWYANRISQEFEAQKLVRYNGKQTMCVNADNLHFVNERDYDILKTVIIYPNYVEELQHEKFNLTAKVRDMGIDKKHLESIRGRIKKWGGL